MEAVDLVLEMASKMACHLEQEDGLNASCVKGNKDGFMLDTTEGEINGATLGVENELMKRHLNVTRCK